MKPTIEYVYSDEFNDAMDQLVKARDDYDKLLRQHLIDKGTSQEFFETEFYTDPQRRLLQEKIFHLHQMSIPIKIIVKTGEQDDNKISE